MYNCRHAIPSIPWDRETEIKQLQGWKGTVENLIEKFHEALAVVGASAAGGSEDGAPATAAEEEDGAAKQMENGDDADTAAGANEEDTPMTDVEAAIPAADGGDSPPPADEATAWEAAAAEAEWGHLSPHQHMQLAKLRVHFHKDVRKQLYGDAEDKQFFEWLKQVSNDSGSSNSSP